MLNPRLDLLVDYPFQRLRDLLDGLSPPDGVTPLLLSIGEPQHATPAIAVDAIAAHAHLWNKYPPPLGTPALRRSIAGWLSRRYELPEAVIDPDTEILPLAGTREGLFQAALACVPQKQPHRDRPAVLVPNPFYQVYAGAGIVTGAEVVFLPATADTGFLPELDRIDRNLLRRCALFYLCSPANPQGVVASREYLEQAVELAHRYDFVLASDECYADIYDDRVPGSALVACTDLGAGLDNVLVFQSLSKRSSAPGLRSGFVAGDAALIGPLARLRSYGGATLPLPVMAASEALWNDDSHVAENRAAYRRKVDVAERVLAGRYGFRRPEGGFFLWLDVSQSAGDGERAARRLWTEAGLRVLPGAYLSRPDAETGDNPGAAYIRVALVHSEPEIEEALTRLVEVLR